MAGLRATPLADSLLFSPTAPSHAAVAKGPITVVDALSSPLTTSASQDTFLDSMDWSNIKLKSEITLHADETLTPWWTPVHCKDSPIDIENRIFDLLCRIRFGCDGVSILVGHSLFFLELIRMHLSDRFKTDQPQFAQQLLQSKLPNAGCVRLGLDWRSPRCISEVNLMFGTELKVRTPKASSRGCR